MKHFLFPKNLQKLKISELFEFCCDVGLDGINAMIRNNYWVNTDNMKTSMPKFVKIASEHGLIVNYADTEIFFENMSEIEKYVSILKENGIKQYRLGYLVANKYHSRDLADIYRKELVKHAIIAEKYDIQAVVQIHGGGLFPHNATTAYEVIKDFSPQHLGVKIDPGNNIAQEGTERPQYQVELLHDYVAAIGIKDAICYRILEGNNIKKSWVSCGEGFTDYREFFRELKNISFSGPGIYMPFYEEEDMQKLKQKLKNEIYYITQIEKEVGVN